MMRTMFLTLFIIGASIGGSENAFPAGRYALLIGNGNYPDTVGRLTNPPNDINLLRNSLTSLGFKVGIVRDASYADLAKSIQGHIALVRDAGDDTISFVYYSGHGAADARTQINYLIPVDVPNAEDTSLWNNSLQLKADILDKLVAQAPNATHFVVFDACRTELRLSVNRMKVFDVDRKSFLPVTATGALVAYSTAERRTASDRGEGSGPYARALAEELLVPGVEAVSVFRNVQLRVKQAIGQDPYLAYSGVPRIFLAGETTVSTQASPSNLPSGQGETIAFERERTSTRSTLSTFLQQLGDEGISAAGVFATAKAWPTGSTVRMCFLDGSKEQRAYVARIGREWTLYGNINFDFDDLSNPRICSKASGSVVRITFKEPGNWSLIGTDAGKLRNGATLSLEIVGQSSLSALGTPAVHGAILHEFGHVVGFEHGWQAASNGCDAEINWESVYKDFELEGWSKEQVDLNIKSRSADPLVESFGFDKKSIMNYAFPPKFFHAGTQSKCYAAPSGELSLKDKLAVYKAYP